VTPNSDWWDRAKLPPRSQPIEIRTRSGSRHGFALRRGSRCKPVKRPRALFAEVRESRLELDQVQPILVAAYVEELQKTHAALSVKQHLSAIRMLFDSLMSVRCCP
jgi:hypothetical protein